MIKFQVIFALMICACNAVIIWLSDTRQDMIIGIILIDAICIALVSKGYFDGYANAKKDFSSKKEK